MSDETSPVCKTSEAEVEGYTDEGPWAGSWKVLTPSMRPKGGSLGVVENRLPPGSVGCPFHWHAREDEVFYVLSGRGLLRYGDDVYEIGPGDCVSCPAGTKVAHQIGNPFDEDLVYLAMGTYDPHEVCGYPDNGKVMVRVLQEVGRLESRDYMDGEPDPPVILGMRPS
ncbi:MAG: cupin domain-containing protein [Myxococcales bacterium]|nr:cupin domain-containing protein [Myxococcales bacterium]